MNEISQQNQPGPPKSVAAVAERAQAAGWTIQWRQAEDGTPRLIISWPNGRNKREVEVGSKRAARLLPIRFERFRVLGDYLAIDNCDESIFEAFVRPSARFEPLQKPLVDMPGVEFISVPVTGFQPPVMIIHPEGKPIDKSIRVRTNKRWRLRIRNDSKPWYIEFSEASESFLAIVDAPYFDNLSGLEAPPTLKIYGLKEVYHHDAVRRLEEISDAVLFDLDLRYDTLYELGRHIPRQESTLHRLQGMERPPSFPQTRYPPEALTLYRYGSSATNMPLLRFLAFYQVLEFFFPQYFQQNLLRRIRQELVDPRFEVGKDNHLARLLYIASAGNQDNPSEREQLKATISVSTDELTLRTFLEDDTHRLDLLGDERRLRGVPVIDTRAPSLIDQVAKHIYRLRCRVVHTKGDGGPTLTEPILPGGPEATALDADIELMRFLAQKAIIAGGTAMT